MNTLSAAQKLFILKANPSVVAVWQQPLKKGPRVVVTVTPNSACMELRLPDDVHREDIEIHVKPPFTDLRLSTSLADHICYNEPVPGGVQIQPRGAPWVGTLGAACSFVSREGFRRWGILSNWHVMCPSPTRQGHAICQPRDNRPAIALLEDWQPVYPDAVNHFDAAIADAKIDGLHTIAPEINRLGAINPQTIDPTVGMDVTKCGRTTAVTRADCIAIDAAVKVNYGDFIANFVDQAIFECTSCPFSQPGDSGSLILGTQDLRPTALLFAGSTDLTVGSPIIPIAARFSLSFHFPET